jgi:IS30 family transposase
MDQQLSQQAALANPATNPADKAASPNRKLRRAAAAEERRNKGKNEEPEQSPELPTVAAMDVAIRALYAKQEEVIRVANENFTNLTERQQRVDVTLQCLGDIVDDLVEDLIEAGTKCAKLQIKDGTVDHEAYFNQFIERAKAAKAAVEQAQVEGQEQKLVITPDNIPDGDVVFGGDYGEDDGNRQVPQEQEQAATDVARN